MRIGYDQNSCATVPPDPPFHCVAADNGNNLARTTLPVFDHRLSFATIGKPVGNFFPDVKFVSGLGSRPKESACRRVASPEL